MLRLGLTGGIASGKTAVAAMLREMGFAVLDADFLAHKLIEPGQPAYDEVVREFGPAILDPGQRVSRAKLAAIVFAERATPPLSKPRSSWKLATTKNWMGWWLPGAVPSSSSSACARAAFPRKKPAAASPRSFPSTKSCATRPKKSTAPARSTQPAAKSKPSPPNSAALTAICHPEANRRGSPKDLSVRYAPTPPVDHQQ